MNRQYIILGVAFVALIGVLVWQLMPREDPLLSAAKPTAAAPGTPPKAGGPAPAPVPVPSTAEAEMINVEEMDNLLLSVTEETFDYASNRISRDPMVPLVGYINPETQGQSDAAAPLPPPRMSLIRSKRVTGVVYDPTDPMAIVDNEVIYPGYTYPDGVVVDSITEDSVVFRFEESKITVELEER